MSQAPTLRKVKQLITFSHGFEHQCEVLWGTDVAGEIELQLLFSITSEQYLDL